MMELGQYLGTNAPRIASLLAQHLGLVLLTAAVAAGAGGVLGFLTSRCPLLEKPVAAAAHLIQTVPRLALIALTVPLLGMGTAPSLGIILVYAVLLVASRTAAGLRAISPDVQETARAMGLTPASILLRIQLPLALPAAMAGVRRAAVAAVGLVTLAAFAGAGGLGQLVAEGLGQGAAGPILAGAVPACLLALGVDGAFAWLEHLSTPLSLGEAPLLPASREELLRRRGRRRLAWYATAAGALLLVGCLLLV